MGKKRTAPANVLVNPKRQRAAKPMTPSKTTAHALLKIVEPSKSPAGRKTIEPSGTWDYLVSMLNFLHEHLTCDDVRSM